MTVQPLALDLGLSGDLSPINSTSLEYTTMIKPTDFTKIRHDVNGNPRYVCHFLQLDVHGMYSGLDLSERYDIALTLARSLGGKKFHNKQYGGGIVFGCVYNLDNLCERINELTNKAEVTA